MSMQQNDSKDTDGIAESAQVTENVIIDPPEGGVVPDSAQTDEQNPAANAAAAADSPESSGETIAEGPHAADGSEKMPESVENISDVRENSPDEADLPKKIAELEAQLAESGDQLLRKAADFENFRKRMNQEKQSAIEFANQMLLLDIIPIIDDFERAIQSAEASEELIGQPAGKAMLDGITMIEKRLVSQLESKWGLKRFNSAGEPFDPNRHEAMFMEKSPDVEEAMVQEDFIKGYLLKDRVIRAAKVKVLVPGGNEE